MKTKRAVAVYDLHYPQYHKPTWDAIIDFLKKNKVDIFIFGGDQFHFDCISHHTANTPLYRVRRGYKNDIEGFKRDILSTLERVLPKNCEKVWHIGNHERFEQDLIECHPELEDAINHVQLLDLESKRWKVIPLGHAYKLGKLTTIHGEVLTGVGNQAGMYPSKKAVELYAGNVLAGHTHAAQSFTRISPVEHNDKWQGWISPIAGAVNPTYLRNRPTAWINGFNIIELFSDGQFNLFPVNIVRGKFCYGGVVYGA